MPFFVEDELNAGDSIELNCYVSKGDRPVNISWTLNNMATNKLTGISETTRDRSSLLTIPSLMANHIGNLTCTATNRAGSTSYDTVLHVNGSFSMNLKTSLSLLAPFLPTL